MTSPLQGTPDDLRDVLAAFEARTAVVEGLATEVRTLVGEVTSLRVAVESRPSRQEVDRKRRRTIFWLVIFGIVLVFLQDTHTERCGPGSRAEAVIDLVVDGKVDDVGGIGKAIANESSSPWCDAFTPFHGHDLDQQSATGAYTYVGWAAYLVGISAFYLWTERPWLYRRDEESPNDMPERRREPRAK